MGSWSVMHWLIVLTIVLLIFGTKGLRSMGNDLGSAIRGFKEGMRDADLDAPPPAISTNEFQKPR